MDISYDKDMGYQILDSGDRTEFETGAVRDMRFGKGRMDLIPWDCSVIDELFPDDAVVGYIKKYYETLDTSWIAKALMWFSTKQFGNLETMMLELAKHFEAGAAKYGDRNWQKGIPTHCYIDSAMRHYMKFKRGDIDERHDRAFVWNLICLVWTAEHVPKVNDFQAPLRLSMRLKRAFSKVRLWVHDIGTAWRNLIEYLKCRPRRTN